MSAYKRFSFFRSDKEAERKPRTRGSTSLTDALQPTVDERTAEMAKTLLNNPAFEIVFDRLRAQRLGEIVNSDPSPAAMYLREEAFRGVKALDTIREDLTALADELKLYAAKRAREGN